VVNLQWGIIGPSWGDVCLDFGSRLFAGTLGFRRVYTRMEMHVLAGVQYIARVSEQKRTDIINKNEN